MLKHAHTMIAVAALSLLAMGCHEKVGVSLHSPGVYKGKTDDLIALSATSEHEKKLRKRFTEVQTDR
jgi:hypothetical protein